MCIILLCDFFFFLNLSTYLFTMHYQVCNPPPPPVKHIWLQQVLWWHIWLQHPLWWNTYDCNTPLGELFTYNCNTPLGELLRTATSLLGELFRTATPLLGELLWLQHPPRWTIYDCRTPLGALYRLTWA